MQLLWPRMTKRTCVRERWKEEAGRWHVYLLPLLVPHSVRTATHWQVLNRSTGYKGGGSSKQQPALPLGLIMITASTPNLGRS